MAICKQAGWMEQLNDVQSMLCTETKETIYVTLTVRTGTMWRETTSEEEV
jgi:hypothetical protein